MRVLLTGRAGYSFTKSINLPVEVECTPCFGGAEALISKDELIRVGAKVHAVSIQNAWYFDAVNYQLIPQSK